MSTDTRPVFTRRRLMHLNGGREWSSTTYEIFRDDQPTGIIRFRKTNGSPKYLITEDLLWKDEESFDVMATQGVGMQEWLESHSRGEAES